MRESALARPVHIFEAYICIVLASVKHYLCNMFYYIIILGNGVEEILVLEVISFRYGTMLEILKTS